MAQMEGSDSSAVAEALLTASRALVAVAARSLAEVDDVVTLPQYRALVVLAAKGPQNVGELADALTIHASTATRLCDRLVAKKLVRRVLSRTNRRETTISLSRRGKDLVDQVTALRRREIDHIVGRIPAAERPSLIAALSTFAEAAGEIPDQSWLLGWS
jgi:DNA-binding MarR family transcriptional regulator